MGGLIEGERVNLKMEGLQVATCESSVLFLSFYLSLFLSVSLSMAVTQSHNQTTSHANIYTLFLSSHTRTLSLPSSLPPFHTRNLLPSSPAFSFFPSLSPLSLFASLLSPLSLFASLLSRSLLSSSSSLPVSLWRCLWLTHSLFLCLSIHAQVSMLSGGERNRLQLAQTLKIGGNLLLLDEPTNDLDVDTLRALEDALLDYAGCEFVFDFFSFSTSPNTIANTY